MAFLAKNLEKCYSLIRQKCMEVQKSIKMSAIIYNNSTPLYLQLKELLSKQIKEGVLNPGDRIPSERTLCEQHNVSRITVRQALNELEKEQLVCRTHGKGTFVAHPKVEQELMTITPFQNTLLSKGLTPKTKFLECVAMRNHYNIGKILNIPLSENIVQLTLLGLSDENPMVFYTSYFSKELGFKMQELAICACDQNQSFSTLDLYKQIPELILSTVSQVFEASIADASIAKILDIKKGTPIFIVESVIYANEEQPVEFKTAVYRGDKYKFSVVRKLHNH